MYKELIPVGGLALYGLVALTGFFVHSTADGADASQQNICEQANTNPLLLDGAGNYARCQLGRGQ